MSEQISIRQATLDDAKLLTDLSAREIGEWYDVLPWREWRADPQLPLTRLVAEQLAACAEELHR